MLSFENTEIAFEYKTQKELKKAHLLFKLISIPWLNSFATSIMQAALKLNLPVKALIKGTAFGHFCGGETLEECDSAINLLAKGKVGTILDYSVEGKQAEEDFDRTLEITLQCIAKGKVNSDIPFGVVKLTGLMPFNVLKKKTAKQQLLAEEITAYNKGLERIQTICANSFEAKLPILIDAEESWIQEEIDAISLSMMQQFNKETCIVYNTAQMYRHDRLAYIKQMSAVAKAENFKLGLKIVRGAYMEKERERAKEKGYASPIQKDKQATDIDFDKAIDYCVENKEYISIVCGTHNEKSSLLFAKKIKEQSSNTQFYFSQLLGMSDHISFNLSTNGYNVAKYMPFGPVKDVMPYLIRRANENTSVAGQTGRELNLLQTELKRRS